jgi:hypothetical protein
LGRPAIGGRFALADRQSGGGLLFSIASQWLHSRADCESPSLRVEIATGELRSAIALRGIHLNLSCLCADF